METNALDNNTVDPETGVVTQEEALPVVSEIIRYWEPEIKLEPEAEMIFRAAIAQKITLVYSGVKAIQERGWNDHFNYSYVLAGDLYEAVRSALSSSHLALIPMLGPQTEFLNAKGNRYLTQHWRMVLMDADTGYALVIPWVSEAMDNEDKGTSKLATSGIKYFCKTFFMIPTGDDLDTDGSGVTADGSKDQRRPSGRGNNPKPSERQSHPKQTPNAKPEEQPKEPSKMDQLLLALRKMDKDIFTVGSKANSELIDFKARCKSHETKWEEQVATMMGLGDLRLEWIVCHPGFTSEVYDKIAKDIMEDEVGFDALTKVAAEKNLAPLLSNALAVAVKDPTTKVVDYQSFSDWLTAQG